MKIWLGLVTILGLAAFGYAQTGGVNAPATTATFITLDVPGGVGTRAYGINNAGDIVGGFDTTDSNARGFLFRDGKLQKLRGPYEYEEATGVSRTGVVVGYTAGPSEFGYMYSNGKYRLILFEVIPNIVTGICDGAGIVGTYVEISGIVHGFLLRNNVLTTIDDPDGADTFIGGINKAGTIVGGSGFDGHSNHGFILEHDTFTTVDVPGAVRTYLNGINSSGAMVGNYTDASDAVHGFLLRDGKFTRIDVSGATSTYASGINDAGMIVGFYHDTNNVVHGFLRIP